MQSIKILFLACAYPHFRHVLSACLILMQLLQPLYCHAGDKAATQLAKVLMQLSFDAQSSALSLTPFLAGLRRLPADWPATLQPYLAALGLLTPAASKPCTSSHPARVSDHSWGLALHFITVQLFLWRDLNSSAAI